MHNLWSDEINRLNVKTVKSKICTKVNYSMTYCEFRNFIANNAKELVSRSMEDRPKFYFDQINSPRYRGGE